MSQKKAAIPRPTSSRLVAPINRASNNTPVAPSANTSALSDCSSISSIRSSVASRGALHQSNSANRLDKIGHHDLPPRSNTATLNDSNERLDATGMSSSTHSNSIGSISMARSSSLSTRAATTTSGSSKTMANRPPFSTSFESSRFGAETTNAASGTDSSSADLVKKIEDLVSRNQTLEEENAILRNLIHEETGTDGSGSRIGKCDERRILMLKCQIYQLEKQINILAKSLAFRKDAHADAQNALNFLADTFRNIAQTAENKSFVTPTSYTIERGDFQRWLEFVESTRIKLNRTQTENDEEIKHLAEPTLFDCKYYSKKSADEGPLSILDICSGNINHINLKEVSTLENELTQLFKKLTRLRESVKTSAGSASSSDEAGNSKTRGGDLHNGKKTTTTTDSGTPSQKRNNKAEGGKRRSAELLPFHRDNLRSQLDDCLNELSSCCQKLFDLSLIVPSAPWAATKRSPVDQLTQEALISRLKSFSLPKLKYAPVEMLVKAHFIASNYHCHMKSLECAALNEELAFYRSSYSLQKDYIESVMNLFKSQYEKFIQELRQHLSQPLQAIVTKFWRMKEDSSEENLKDFLNLFKTHAKRFETIMANMSDLTADREGQDDVLSLTFDQLISQLDAEVEKLNRACLNNLEKLNLHSINLGELSLQSDQLLMDIVKKTPQSSPTLTPSSSINEFK